MEATSHPAPSPEPEPETIRVNPADVVDVKELSEDELRALVADDESEDSEATEENPSHREYGEIFASLFGGIVGFIGAGYLNNYVLQTLLKSATAPTSAQLLQYAAILFVVELVIGAFLIYMGMKHDRKGLVMDFVEDLGLGIAIAGTGTLVSQYLINSGQTNVVLPAVNFAGKPLVPADRVVST